MEQLQDLLYFEKITLEKQRFGIFFQYAGEILVRILVYTIPIWENSNDLDFSYSKNCWIFSFLSNKPAFLFSWNKNFSTFILYPSNVKFFYVDLKNIRVNILNEI